MNIEIKEKKYFSMNIILNIENQIIFQQFIEII